MTDPLLGSVISGRYRIDHLIARGGMGSIYLAEQVPLGRSVALKVLVPQSLRADDTGELRRRFLREAETCARLRHPNTVIIHDYGTLPLPDGEGEGLYIAMEFVAGRTLSQAIREDGPFAPERVRNVAVQIARSLREAHAAGIVHRDLKPGNVMLTPGGDEDTEGVKVLDFGVAKVMGEGADGLTLAGSFVGSPRYASPEQIQEMEVDGRSDLYALGVVMYEMLCGKPPFLAPDTIRMLMMHVRDTPAPLTDRVPTIPPQLAALVHALLEKEPSHRPADADAVIQALRTPTAMPTEPLSVDTPTWKPPTVAGPPPRSRWPWAVAGLGMLAVVALCAGGTWLAVMPDAPGAGAVPPAVAPTPVQVTSTPPGAEVWEGTTKLGVTPLVVPVAGETRLRVHLDGYDDVERVVTDADLSWSPTLTGRPVEPPTPPPPTPPKSNTKPNPPKGDGIRTSR